MCFQQLHETLRVYRFFFKNEKFPFQRIYFDMDRIILVANFRLCRARTLVVEACENTRVPKIKKKKKKNVQFAVADKIAIPFSL